MKHKTSILGLFTRVGNVLIMLAMLLSLVGVSASDAAPAGTALQFNGSNQYVTFGKASPNNGYLVGTPTWTTTNQKLGASALIFNGTSQYAAFGKATELGAATFTLEVWFNWTGGGSTTSTGSGGITAIPLITKGRGEADSSNLDCNYFLGIAGSKLAADFEDMATGGNHPVTGNTTITTNTWHHAAVTYDGTTWILYLDGNPDATLAANATPRYDSIQHAGLGTAMTSTGTAGGYFAGTLDEARIWNIARAQAEIQSTMNSEVTTSPGLIGRWGMNEGSGNTIRDTSQPGGLGALTFTIETWIRRTGTGVATSTGSGGVTSGIPLVSKGMAEFDGNIRDMNYFLGIRSTDNVLAADFEDTASGANHPVYGVTPILADGIWHHVAATFDGASFKLYLDGVQDGTPVSTTAVPRYDSIQYAAIGTALNSCGIPGNATCFNVTGQTAGYFAGAMDEVRIWNYARTATEISDNRSTEITTASGLIGRWGMNEGTGSTIFDSSTVSNINGSLISSPTWAEGFPLPGTNPPADPSNLTATTASAFKIDLAWTDNASDESAFEIERCTGLSCSSFSMLASLPANTITYSDSSAQPQIDYCYRVRATNSGGPSGYSNTACATTSAEGDYALDLTPNTYVSFGDANSLDLAQFTLETWFRRDATGTPNTTGAGGIANAIPLISNGAPEADNSNVDMNYVLCLNNDTSVLCADFEEGVTGSSPGLNHPINGQTPILTGQWYHAAVTYDGTSWALYLNGNLEAQANISQPVRSDNISPTALATMIQSNGTTALGFFDGVLDEVRIWNYARSQSEILATINTQITTSQTGLVARWGLNEGTGVIVHNTANPSVIGNIFSTGYAWPTPGAPFNLTFAPPNGDPSNLTATLAPGSQIDLAWTDGSTNESAFAVEYALGPNCSTWSALGTSLANVAKFRHWNTAVDTQYCYRVRATNPGGNSSFSNTATANTPEGYSAFSMGQDHAYVRFPSDVLHLKQFTLETWFRREGPGAYNTTGTGGIPQAIPLIAKGAAEAESTTADENFLLVIDDATDVLAADFEECDPATQSPDCVSGGTAGLNHPILGTTPISLNTWYHAAVTYDGNKWQLFLNGGLERELVVGRLPRWDNNAPAGLGTSMTTGGAAQGFFDGSLDEVRIWDYARSQAEIQSTMNVQIGAPTSGLVARWALDESSGTIVYGSAGTAINGSIYPTSPTGWNWTGDAPFNATLRPDVPALVLPLDGANGVTRDPTVNLVATVNDPDTSSLTASFYGRPYCSTAPNFTLAVLPDTQYYSSGTNSGTRAMFDSQTQWIVTNRLARNIVYTTHLGDIVDTYSATAQWDIAGRLTDPKGALTKLDDAGMKYGLAVGNHDGAPGNTGNFNSYFPFTRVGDGHYGSDNDNNFGLFSSGGMNFIVIHIEYGADAATRAWANDLLSIQYPTRRAIVVTHNLLSGNTSPAPFSTEGQALYDALKGNPNLFLMLGGHLDTEVSRTDTYNGHTVYSLRSDYQTRTGGNGWLRLLEFQPAANQIQVYTYSPYLTQWETDADSQFTLPYAMGGTGCAPWQLISTNTGVASGSTTTTSWSGLGQNTQYQWYVSVSDGTYTVPSSVWSFTTAASTAMDFQASWNLATLPLQPASPYDAETWLLAINAQGGNCSEIAQWNNGGWESYLLGYPFDPFAITMGKGYFVRCAQPNTWVQQGIRPGSGVTINLSPGFNLVGFPYPVTGYTAQSLLTAMNSQGGTCSEIHHWVNGGWESFILGYLFDDFSILPFEGYFVKCTTPSSFTP